MFLETMENISRKYRKIFSTNKNLSASIDSTRPSLFYFQTCFFQKSDPDEAHSEVENTVVLHYTLY